jgi:hypothetical protein
LGRWCSPAGALDRLIDHCGDASGEVVAGDDVGSCAVVEEDPLAVHADQSSGQGGAGVGQRLQAQASTGARIGWRACIIAGSGSVPHTIATVVCALLTPSTGAPRMCSAGHPPPILARSDGETTTLVIPADLPLGVETGHPPTQVRPSLHPGAALCLYSDGLVERRGVVIDENIEKLRNTVMAQSPESVCVEVMRRLVGFTKPQDDVAVLVARRLQSD